MEVDLHRPNCGVDGTGPFSFYGKNTMPLSGSDSEPVTDCWAGHTYVTTYTATDSQGRVAQVTSTVTVLPPPPTATFTINGSKIIRLKVGDTINYAWSSTGGTSARAVYTQDSSSCGVIGTGPFGFFGPKSLQALGGSMSEPITDCWAGHTYVVTYAVKDSYGRIATSSAMVQVLSSATSTSAAFGQQLVATSAVPDVASMLGAVAAAPFSILVDSFTDIFVAFGVGQ